MKVNNSYPIFTLLPNPESKDSRLGIEQMGSKRKFWVLIDKLPGRPWLFKYARNKTGEHWAEKIDAEIAPLMKLPAVNVELAEFDGHPGAIVESLIPHEMKGSPPVPVKTGELIHGNELLAGRVVGYEKTKQRKQYDHSWDNICTVFRDIVPTPDINIAMQAFAGLLVLDALIVNTDRHHENWALLALPNEKALQLSHSYDHASSLGRELTDKKRADLLSNGKVWSYIQNAHGAIYGKSMSSHPDNPLELVKWASKKHYSWFEPWLKAVENIPLKEYAHIVERVPLEVMSHTAKQMVVMLLEYTSRFLKELII